MGRQLSSVSSWRTPRCTEEMGWAAFNTWHLHAFRGWKAKRCGGASWSWSFTIAGESNIRSSVLCNIKGRCVLSILLYIPPSVRACHWTSKVGFLLASSCISGHHIRVLVFILSTLFAPGKDRTLMSTICRHCSLEFQTTFLCLCYMLLIFIVLIVRSMTQKEVRMYFAFYHKL